MTILCLGVNHRAAPVAVREKLAYSPPALDAALARVGCGRPTSQLQVSELAILSTCNRVELYAVISDDGPDLAHHFGALERFLAETRNLDPASVERCLQRHAGTDAVRHLCRVAAGLDSMVLGESEILGQVAHALTVALRNDAARSLLSALFRTAIRAGKRARMETAIGRNPASVSSVAVQLAAQMDSGSHGHRVLVIGAGKMGRLAASALRSRGDWEISVANRTRERAAELAELVGGDALSFEQLPEAIANADIVITSSGAPHTIIGAELVREAMSLRPDRALVFIDIAVPRDVEPAVREIGNVRVFDIDDLQARVAQTVVERGTQVPSVEAIVAEEVTLFQEWQRSAALMPVVSELRQNAEVIRRREVARTLRRLPGLDAESRQQIEQLSLSLVNKLLHEPTRRLRAEAGAPQTPEFARVARELFGLPVGTEPPVSVEEQL